MKNIRLVFPTPAMEEKVLSFKQEFYANGERTIPGSYKLDQERYTYSQWLEIINSNLTEQTANPKFGTSETYFAENEHGVLVGILNLRHTLTPFYKDHGHIGISVLPSKRKQGYASAMLSAALPLARQRGISELKLVCSSTNAASRGTILSCGGSSARTFSSDGTDKEEYIIYL